MTTTSSLVFALLVTMATAACGGSSASEEDPGSDEGALKKSTASSIPKNTCRSVSTGAYRHATADIAPFTKARVTIKFEDSEFGRDVKYVSINLAEGSRTENVDRLKSDAEDASNGIELWEEDFTEHRQDSDCADGESNCARASIVQSPEGNWMLRSLAGHPKRWLGLKSIPLECAPGALDYLVGLTN